MSEKGDMPGDTVSLPPTYAPSEAFTDSPPPAYRGAKSSRVQIVKMVCVTVVVATFVIGFFIITSNYLNARACQCPQNEAELEKLKAAGFFKPPRASGLVGLENNHLEEKVKKGKGKQLEEEIRPQEGEVLGFNDLDSGDDTTLPKVDIEVVEEEGPLIQEIPQEIEAIVEEAELEMEKELVREEAEEEALRDVLEAQVEHMKKIRLPIDLILGNPALAGRDVNCEVERRQQPLGVGVMTQAIIVTCRDPDDQPRPAQPRRPTPPLSILAPIMKMLSSRPVQPRPAPCGPNKPCFSGPAPFPQMLLEGRNSGPAPFPQMLLEGRNSGPAPFPQMLVEGRNSGPTPFHQMLLESRNSGPMNIRGPIPIMAVGPQPRLMALEAREEEGPRNKMLPIRLQPLVRVSPRIPRLLTPPQPFPAPMSLASLHRGALPLPMPQPRAAKDPISLPGLRLRPNHFLPQALNVMRGARRIDPRPVTHMEMRAPPPSPQPPPRPTPPFQMPKEFGPPRVHTVISPAIPKHFKPESRGPISPPKMPHNIRIQTNPLPKDVMTPPKPIALMPQPSAGPIAGPLFPPPPRFDPNGRKGVMREINTDAEIFVKDLPQLSPPESSHIHLQPSPPQPSPPQSQPSPPQPQASQPRKHHLLLVN